jgi:hypothetical protein
MCWSVTSVSCATLAPDTVAVTVNVNYCGGAPDCDCGYFPNTYQRTCNFGLMAAGSYVAEFREIHTNSYDPLATFTMTAPFAVSDPTPTLRRTWGSLKSIYR